MSSGHSQKPSDSIKVVPGRSKLRVESSNPVARGNPLPKHSKVKLITPEEAIKLSSGLSQGAVPPVSEPPRPKIARATYNSPRSEAARAASEAPRPNISRSTSEPPRAKPARATSDTPPIPVPAVRAPQAPRSVPAVRTPQAPKPVRARPTSEPPRRGQAHSATASRKEIVCGLRALSVMDTTSVRQRTNPRSSNHRPPSPRALQIRSRVKQQDANATHTVEGTVLEAGDKAKDHGAKETGQSTSDHGAKETRQSTSDERISELRLYRPALHPTWKGRIVDSATLPEFDCEFCANPASLISRKALRLSKAMPTLLKVELLPTGHILNDVLDRIPRLSDVELYLFSDDKETERSKREHAHLFEAMSTRNAMMKANINGTELLIFSSKLLDKTCQYFLKKQFKTENYLWGFFLHKKNSQTHGPGTTHQTDKYFDDRDVVDMEIDTEYETPDLDLARKIIAESHNIPSTSPVKVNSEVSVPPGFENLSRSLGKVNKEVSVPPGFENLSRSPGKVNKEVSVPPGFENLSRSPGKVNKEVSLPPGFENPSRSPGKVNKEVSVPPGFEKIWAPPLVTLNIHGTSHALSGLTASAGLVRNQSGKWVFGYSRCHKNISEVASVLLAIYHGLKLLWDSGCRRIRLETTSLDVIGALTTEPKLFYKKKSILGLCKDLILKDWECEIYHIAKERNSCAEWLANRLEGQQSQGFDFFEYPPLGLVDLLEKDRLESR